MEIARGSISRDESVRDAYQGYGVRETEIDINVKQLHVKENGEEDPFGPVQLAEQPPIGYDYIFEGIFFYILVVVLSQS